MSRFGFVFLLLIASVAARASEPLAPDYLQCVNKGDGEVIRAEITRDASGAYFGQAKLFDDSGRLLCSNRPSPIESHWRRDQHGIRKPAAQPWHPSGFHGRRSAAFWRQPRRKSGKIQDRLGRFLLKHRNGLLDGRSELQLKASMTAYFWCLLGLLIACSISGRTLVTRFVARVWP